MKLINNTETSIYVNDIGVAIPIRKMGIATISDELFSSSKELILLINSGKVTLSYDFNESFKFTNEGKEYISIPGSVIWAGEGKTVPQNKISGYSVSAQKDFNSMQEKFVKSLPKKYKITRKQDLNISIEKISCVLTKQNPSRILSEEEFRSSEIQRAIAVGLIQVVEVMQAQTNSSGGIVWVPATEEKSTDPQQGSVTVVDKNPEFSGVQCIWEGPILDSGGYANMNRQYVITLTKMGVAVRPILVSTAKQVEKSLEDEMTRLSYTPVNPNCPKIYATNVPGRHRGFTVAYTMMETEERVHESLARSMEVANELWVPCEWNKQTFTNGGVKKPIKVMPLAINEDLYKPADPTVVWNFPTKGYVFYSVSTWLWRKGFDVLLKAYSKAFTADDDVSLIIFTHVPGTTPDNFAKVIKNTVYDFVGGKTNLPHLAVVTSYLDACITPRMYNSVDSFVLFSRGEGWGLPYCEAAASGLPIIGADHGGQKMFLNRDNALLVEPDQVVGCHPSLLPVSPFYHGMKFVSYSDKAIDEAAEKMRFVYENREKMKEMAVKCRTGLLENNTWRISAKRVAQRLKEIQ